VEVVDSVLLSRLDALDEAREIAAQYFAAVDVEGLDLVRVKVRSRLRHGTANTVVAIAGATGSGKSSIVNRLAGSNLSEASVRRPTTSATHAVIWGAADAGPLLDWLEISRRHQIEMQHADFDGLVVLDLPDHDSTAVEHRLEVDRLVELVDVVVWVTDPQKYADAALHHGYIQPLATHAGMLRFVLNQIDRLGDGGSAVAADLARLLDDDGIPNAEIIAVSALTGDGFGQLEAVLARAIAERSGWLLVCPKPPARPRQHGLRPTTTNARAAWRWAGRSHVSCVAWPANRWPTFLVLAVTVPRSPEQISPYATMPRMWPAMQRPHGRALFAAP